MRNPYPFLISITIWCYILLKPSQQHQNKHCIHRCGNTDIPYPFGIGSSHCYLNKNSYFSVICKNSSSSSSTSQIPYLKNLNLEIIEILPYSSIITVKIPSIKSCNGTQIKWDSPNLQGTPFSFTGDDETDRHRFNSNVVVSFGCGGFAVIYDGDEEVEEGCTSICRNDNYDLNSNNSSVQCSGFNNCCLINTLSKNKFSLRVSSDNRTGDCRFVGIVSRDYLANNISSFEFARISAFPVALEWDFALYNPNTSSVLFDVIRFGVLSVASFILAGCCVLQCWCCKTRKSRKEINLRKKYFKGRLLEERLINEEEALNTKLYTKNEINKATENFNEDRIIGAGGQGTVYKGMLTNGELIAVKKSNSLSETQLKEFINEVILLSQINHRNVVKLLGCCLETKDPLLVYEFIPNGTLSEFIHNPNNEELQLTWDVRVRIASEVSIAIAYLHSSCSIPIYHRDIKSSNILLDRNYKAKVCDFGISRSASIDQTHLTTLVRGTFGYLDPQYFRSSQFSEKSDVYSFGVVLVEILTGKKPINVTSEYATSLVMQFMSLSDDSVLYELLDPIILVSNGVIIEDVIAIVNLAKSCLNPQGIGRPTMMQVSMELARLNQKLLTAKLTPNDFKRNDSDKKLHIL